MSTAKTTDQALQKGNLPGEQKKADKNRPDTVTPDNDNGEPGAPANSKTQDASQHPEPENPQ